MSPLNHRFRWRLLAQVVHEEMCGCPDHFIVHGDLYQKVGHALDKALTDAGQ